jgi:hypothetical protein
MATRVEAPPAGGGGWELVADQYTLLVDFNQSGFTLHQLRDTDAADDSGDQPCGSQGAPPEPDQQTEPVDVAYADIRSIKRGAPLSLAPSRVLFLPLTSGCILICMLHVVCSLWRQRRLARS